MGRIQIDSTGRIAYYGNLVGYVDRQNAVVDPIFQSDELCAFLARRGLEPTWTDGVYDRLASGAPLISEEGGSSLKACRLWQLKGGVEVSMKFLPYEKLLQSHGPPDPADYQLAYDGQVETNDPEALYDKFRLGRPPGFTGEHPIAMSDVIELHDSSGSEFYYVDQYKLLPIEFGGQQEQGQVMSL